MLIKNEFNNPHIIIEVDKLLEDHSFTAEQVFNNMANGLIVSNEDDVVTIFNPAAEGILGIAESKYCY